MLKLILFYVEVTFERGNNLITELLLLCFKYKILPYRKTDQTVKIKHSQLLPLNTYHE